MVTIIADNYYGYCKKEVKTQISFAANLFGMCEEEHAGGAIAFATYVLGQEFYAGRTVSLRKAILEEAMRMLGDWWSRGRRDMPRTGVSRHLLCAGGRGLQRPRGTVRWTQRRPERALKLRRDALTCCPPAFACRLEKQTGGLAWRLVGARPRGTLCHKPCTVSGGGKSEISKSIANAMLKGPVFVRDYHSDMDQVAEILAKDFSQIYQTSRSRTTRTRRPILSPERTLGSVIQLMTPSPEYTDEHNAWLQSLPQIDPPACVHRETLLPPGMGRKLARAFHRGSHQRLSRARAEV